MKKSANNKLWIRYIRFLGYKHSKNLISIDCWGGCWFLPYDPSATWAYELGYQIDDMFIKPSREKRGLQVLTPDVDSEFVQEYFTDLIIYKSQVIRLNIKIELHLN